MVGSLDVPVGARGRWHDGGERCLSGRRVSRELLAVAVAESLVGFGDDEFLEMQVSIRWSLLGVEW